MTPEQLDELESRLGIETAALVTPGELRELVRMARRTIGNNDNNERKVMALETLKGVTEINGVEIKRVTWKQPSENFIEVNDEHNAITFKIQNGPIKEMGKNGCQVTDVIAVAKHILEQLNAKFPCRENAVTITKLDEALMWQAKRTSDREKRGVEGTARA